MIRSQSRSSIVDDVETSQLEKELVKLKRSYRVMQNDYRAYREQTKRSVNKQSALIEELEREREELDTILGKMASDVNMEKDEQNAEFLKDLSASGREFEQLIEEERSRIRDLDGVVMEMERKIAEQRKSMGGSHQSTSKHIAAAKQTAVLENRLDKAIVHFNKQLATNAKLRQDIDHCCREKKLFASLFKRLSKELEHTQRDIAEVIKVSSHAFEQRDEAHTKINALKERSEKDQKQHDAEMKECERIISHDNKMKEFMFLKTNERSEYKAEEAAKKKRYQNNMDADQIFMKSYEDAFKRIKQVTHLSDIKAIVENFVTNEEENFALFNYVNELNCEAEALNDEVAQIKQQIQIFLEQDNQVDNQHAELVMDLEAKYRKVEEESNQTEQRLKKVNKILDHVKHDIEKLFKRLNCDAAPIEAMLGGESGINNKNAMIYLGQIEQRTIDLLHTLRFQKEKRRYIEGGIKNNIGVKDKEALPVPQVQNITIATPSWVDLDTDGDTDNELRPLTQLELRQRVTKEMERRANIQVQAEMAPHINQEFNRPRDNRRNSRRLSGKM